MEIRKKIQNLITELERNGETFLIIHQTPNNNDKTLISYGGDVQTLNKSVNYLGENILPENVKLENEERNLIEMLMNSNIFTQS